MATLKIFVRAGKQQYANVRFRLLDGRKIDLYYKSDILIEPDLFDAKKAQYKAKALVPNNLRDAVNTAITDTAKKVLDIYQRHRPTTSEQLTMLVNNIQQPIDLYYMFQLYMDNNSLSDNRKRHYLVVMRYIQQYNQQAIKPIDLHTFSEFDLNNIQVYLAKGNRSQNTITGILKKIRAVVRYANKLGYTANNPFTNYKLQKEVYGTPIYLTMDERNAIYDYDFSNSKKIEQQRDIFVFQCLVGCRVQNLLQLTHTNIANGYLEYIPSKGIKDKATTVRVPLSQTALEILTKYKDSHKTKILPFISSQKYNEYIKTILEACGINRMVTVYNPLKQKEERKPIYEVASSHMARRTFIGNLYRKVQDTNIISSMSGHTEGSKAFARYRAIDDEIKENIIKLID